ncbi:MAG: hypothetical protein OEZ51_09040 [Nitrospinota bacterium]|nr:hypothetical protein [Nitrospinota bacterium]
MGNFLVIGGSGVMGTAAIQAVRAVHGDQANIIANWYGKEDTGLKIENANHTIFGDVTDSKCLEAIKSQATDYEYMFYATALGDVGIPIKNATQEQIDSSNRLSFDPIPMLEQALNIKTIVTYSTFYVTRHQLGSYGAMGYSKEAIEKWTMESGKSKRACIRAGLFESQSSRGIKLLLRKSAKHLENIEDPLIRSYFENVSTKEGIDRYLEGIINEERELFGDSPTKAEDLYQAHLDLFNADNPKFVNVCGKKIWLTEEPQLIKDHL